MKYKIDLKNKNIRQVSEVVERSSVLRVFAIFISFLSLFSFKRTAACRFEKIMLRVEEVNIDNAEILRREHFANELLNYCIYLIKGITPIASSMTEPVINGVADLCYTIFQEINTKLKDLKSVRQPYFTEQIQIKFGVMNSILDTYEKIDIPLLCKMYVQLVTQLYQSQFYATCVQPYIWRRLQEVHKYCNVNRTDFVLMYMHRVAFRLQNLNGITLPNISNTFNIGNLNESKVDNADCGSGMASIDALIMEAAYIGQEEKKLEIQAGTLEDPIDVDASSDEEVNALFSSDEEEKKFEKPDGKKEKGEDEEEIKEEKEKKEKKNFDYFLCDD